MVTTVHDDIGASMWEGMSDSNKNSMIISVIFKIGHPSKHCIS